MDSAVSVPLGCFSRFLFLGIALWGLSLAFGWSLPNPSAWHNQAAALPAVASKWGAHLRGVLLFYGVQISITFFIIYALVSLVPGEVGKNLQKLLSDFAKQSLRLIFRLLNLILNGIFRLLHRLVEGGLNRH